MHRIITFVEYLCEGNNNGWRISKTKLLLGAAS